MKCSIHVVCRLFIIITVNNSVKKSIACCYHFFIDDDTLIKLSSCTLRALTLQSRACIIDQIIISNFFLFCFCIIIIASSAVHHYSAMNIFLGTCCSVASTAISYHHTMLSPTQLFYQSTTTIFLHSFLPSFSLRSVVVIVIIIVVMRQTHCCYINII